MVPGDEHVIDEYARLVADVYELAGVLRRHGDELAGRVGQTQARWQLLSVISDEQPWTVPRAAERLGVSRQAVQRVADDLTRDGLARYVPNPQHRRSPLLELTGSGREALAAITAAARDWQDEVTRGLDTESVAAARRGLREVRARIAELDATDTTDATDRGA